MVPSVSKDPVIFIFKGKQLFDCLPNGIASHAKRFSSATLLQELQILKTNTQQYITLTYFNIYHMLGDNSLYIQTFMSLQQDNEICSPTILLPQSGNILWFFFDSRMHFMYQFTVKMVQKWAIL
jgi:hypothetical protein